MGSVPIFTESGFLGTDKVRRPLWADEAPTFDHLEVFSAAAVANGDIAMPDDEEPDF